MADDTSEPKTVVVSEDDSRPSWRVWRSKKILVGLVVALVLAAGLLLLWPVIRSTAGDGLGAIFQRDPGPCSNDTDLIRRYNAVVKKSGITKLTDIQKTVQSKSGYMADPTCVYMVTMSQFGQGDTVSAAHSYETLKKLQADGQKPSSSINDGIDRNNIYGLIQTQIDDSKKGYYGQG